MNPLHLLTENMYNFLAAFSLPILVLFGFWYASQADNEYTKYPKAKKVTQILLGLYILLSMWSMHFKVLLTGR